MIAIFSSLLCRYRRLDPEVDELRRKVRTKRGSAAPRFIRISLALVLALLPLGGLWLISPRHVSATGISFVQGNARTGSGSPLFTAYPLSVGSGHLLVGVFRAEGSPSVGDNLNGAWNEAASNRFASIWYRPDAKYAVRP